MSESWSARAVGFVLAVALAPATPFAGPGAAAGDDDENENEKVPPSLLGPVSREQLEAAEPSWVAAMIEAELDAAAAQALAEVPPGAEVTVYLGTWCSDSKRELSRLWRALDETGGMVPFSIQYIAVDRADARPPELERDLDLRYVPTFIVRRGGEEVGRMVEESPGGIERDLLALLSGGASGVISARDDVGAGEPAVGSAGHDGVAAPEPAALDGEPAPGG